MLIFNTEPVAVKYPYVVYYLVFLALGVSVYLASITWIHFPSELFFDNIGAVATLSVGGIATRLTAVALPGDAGRSSILYLPALCALVIAGPVAGGLVAALSVAAGDFITGRRPIKIVFNFSQFLIAGLLSGWLYYGLGGTWVVDARIQHLLIPFLIAAGSFFLVNRFLLALILVVSDKRSFITTWRVLDDHALPLDITLSLTAVPLAALYWHFQAFGLTLALTVILALALWPRTSMGRSSPGVSS